MPCVRLGLGIPRDQDDEEEVHPEREGGAVDQRLNPAVGQVWLLIQVIHRRSLGWV
jgi:hypothetical protein